MNCPACYSEIDDRSYRCKECHRITSYRRFCWRYRYLVVVLLGLIAYWTVPGGVRRWLVRDYNKPPLRPLAAHQMTMGCPSSSDKGRVFQAAHYKSHLVQLRDNV